MDPALQALSVQLSEVAVRNAAAAVAERISSVKTRKRNEETIAALEEIVNELLADKAELTRIAQAFDDELVAQRLSADDVRYITDNLLPLVRQLAEATPASPGSRSAGDVMDLLEPLVSVETLTILQLMGLNFREAIGQPLTRLIASLIDSQVRPEAVEAADLQRAIVERDIAIAHLATNPEAYGRWRALTGGGDDS